MDNKRDIVEVAEELGIELEFHDGAGVPYYTALCPLHDNTKTPAFAIFPKVQRFYCYACTPEGGDVIDLVRKLNNLSFKEAVKLVCFEVPPEDAVVQSFSNSIREVDYHFLQMRACKLNDHPRRFGFEYVQALFDQFDFLMSRERWLDADRLLTRAGV